MDSRDELKYTQMSQALKVGSISAIGFRQLARNVVDFYVGTELGEHRNLVLYSIYYLVVLLLVSASPVNYTLPQLYECQLTRVPPYIGPTMY